MDRTHLKILFNCESYSDECDLAVLLRRRMRAYVDEGKWQSVPSEWFGAERVF